MAGFLSNLFHRNRKLTEPVRFDRLVDHHSHILPGVDDGVRNIDDSLRILAEYERLGFSEVWLTPHIMEDFPNTTDDLRRRFAKLSEAYHGPITLHLAAENMMDELFMERLEANDFLPQDESRLLVETSYFQPPMGLYDILADIMKRGYRPMLAHPERYVYMKDDDYAKILDMGIMLQLNILSLKGFYGEEAQKKAHRLAKKGAYSFIGTDIHNFSQVRHVESIFSDARNAAIAADIIRKDS